MSLFIEEEGNIKLDFDTEEIAALVIDAALELADCPYEAEVNVLITDLEGIREYNNDYRGIDSPTDVLSFPAVDYPAPADFSIAASDVSSYFNPETGELMLGDIILCHDRIVSQAEEFGHSQLREFTFLIVHSMLHLMGYDHMTPDEEREMFAHQNDIMNELGIFR